MSRIGCQIAEYQTKNSTWRIRPVPITAINWRCRSYTQSLGDSVNIDSRIADLAGDGEILTSDLTRQLMIGSRAAFDERGERELKGVPGSWPLYGASLG